MNRGTDWLKLTKEQQARIAGALAANSGPAPTGPPGR